MVRVRWNVVIAVAGVVAALAVTTPPAQGEKAAARVVLVSDKSRGIASDRPIIALLEQLGEVTVVNDDLGWTGPEVRQADLVAISATVDANRSFAALATVPVPIVTWSGAAVTDLRMGARPRPLGRQSSITIVDRDDPLAAGNSDSTRVTTRSSSILVSEPGPVARIVAHAVNRPTMATIYRYEPGDLLIDGSVAPSCRIALFPTAASSQALTTAGLDLVRAALVEGLACGERSLDADGDRITPPLDCDDTDPSISPLAVDEPGDGIDQNCDGYDLPTSDHRPVKNVVMVFTDDMTYTDYPYMPQTQALLGGAGVTFTQSHHNTPLCCPARATFLTGQRSPNHSVVFNKPEEGGGYAALDHSNTIATWFAGAGFDTTYIGKFLNGYGQDGIYPGVTDNREIPPGWTTFQPIVGNPAYYGFTINDHGTMVRPSGYQTDVLADLTRTSIRKSAAGDRPFFVMVSTPAPHTYGNALPPLPAPRHRGMFADLPAPRPPSYNEQQIGDKPPWIRRQPRLSSSVQARLDNLWRNRLESLQAVDDLVAGLVEELTVNGVLDETLILFTSDNGYLLGEHRLTGKIVPYEESTRVPLVIRGGPFTGGETVDSLVSSIDIVPTLLSVAGVAPDLVTDGVDLSDILVRPERYENRALLIESATGPGYGAIRTERWLWVEYAGTARELYDNANDPYQLESLHTADGEPALVRSELSALLGQLRTCVGAADCMAYSPVD